MKKKFTIVLTVALLLTGCTQEKGSSDSEKPVTEVITDVSASDTDAEESFSSETEPPVEETESEEADIPAEGSADLENDMTVEDYYPAMPAEDETAMSDAELKAEITEAVMRSYLMEQLMLGACSTYTDEGFFGEVIPDIVPEGEGAYHEVNDIHDKSSLMELFSETFTENYLSALNPSLEEQLFGDIAEHYTADGESILVPYYKEQDGKLLAYSAYIGVAYKPDYYGLVITSATEDTVCACVAGTCLSIDNWSIGEYLLKKENGVWKTDSSEWRYADCMGKILSKRLSADNLSILGKICGNVSQTGEEKLINDYWYYPVEQFMTIDEMYGFLHSNFTEETAKLYEPYIECFLEQGGALYHTKDARGDSNISVTNPKRFGSYDLTYSVPVSALYSDGVETTTSQIPWNDGFGNVTEIKVVLVNGKIASELPCTYVGE